MRELSAHNLRIYLAIAVVSAASFVIMFELSNRLE